MKGFVELLQHQFDQNAGKPAILYHNDVVTYSQLHNKAAKVGHLLQQKGFEQGDRVVLFTPDKLALLITHLGIILSGGVSLPLNFGFTEDEMLYFLNDSGARFVFASGRQAELVTRIKDRCPNLVDVLDPTEAIERGGSSKIGETSLSMEDGCFMLYSSGTTGRPKGVVHTQENLAASLLALQACWKFTADDVLLNVLPLFHIHGLSFAAHLSLISGSTMLLEDKFHPLKTMDVVSDATVFMAVPTIYYAFLRRGEFREKATTWSRTRLFTCGSAPLQSDVLPELESILNKPLINRYGMTESHVITSLPLDGPHPQGSVGVPLDGIDMKLVTEDNRSIPASALGKNDIDVVGEVKIRGKNLFHGYWKDPDSTVGAFDQDGYFSTGDLGHFDEHGCLTLVGRKKDLVIIDGYNVYPAVVERVLNSFAQVKECAVIGLPDPRRGEKVVAVVVPESELNETELKALCKAKLADYQVPAQFEFAEALPRNAMGKVLKRELRDELSK
jgi:malonyl-CoA/methylmalonyl-CoA synthetase